MGVDFGDVRIGLAVSDPTGTIARPLRTITPYGSLDEHAASVVTVSYTHLTLPTSDLV